MSGVAVGQGREKVPLSKPGGRYSASLSNGALQLAAIMAVVRPPWPLNCAPGHHREGSRTMALMVGAADAPSFLARRRCLRRDAGDCVRRSLGAGFA